MWHEAMHEQVHEQVHEQLRKLPDSPHQSAWRECERNAVSRFHRAADNNDNGNARGADDERHVSRADMFRNAHVDQTPPFRRTSSRK